MATLGSRALASLRDLSVKASRGTVSGYVLNAPHQFGQPLRPGEDIYGLITPQRMAEIMQKTPTASACMNAIIDFCATVKIGVRNVNAALPADPGQTKVLEDFMKNPNPQDTWLEFFKAWLKDMIVFGYAGVEIERNRDGGVANMYVVDNQRIRVDFDEHGTILGFAMLNARGVPIHETQNTPYAWQPNEIIWCRLDPDSTTPYGKSRVVQLFAPALLEGLMMSFIGGRFTDSNIPFGVMDLGDVTVEEVDYAIEKWNEQAQQNGDHRVIVTGSRGGAKWMPFGYHLKDLDATNLLNVVRRQIMGTLGVTMNELGESQDINKANGYNLSFVFKKRAIEPLLRELTTKFTTHLIHTVMGFTDLELYFDEIDSRDELLQGQIDDLYFKMGVWTPNHIANRKGQPSMPGGDERFVFTGRDYLPLRLLAAYAEAQLQSLQLVNAQIQQQMQLVEAGGTAEGDGASISPPKIKAPSLPDMPQAPGTSGHSGALIRFPQPKQQAVPKSEQSSSRPRGPVQTLRNTAGVRKENM